MREIKGREIKRIKKKHCEANNSYDVVDRSYLILISEDEEADAEEVEEE